MRHAYVGIGDFEREILIAVNVAAQRSQILQRIGNHLHSDLRRTRQTSDVLVECYEFIGQLAHLGKSPFGNLPLAIRNPAIRLTGFQSRVR